MAFAKVLQSFSRVLGVFLFYPGVSCDFFNLDPLRPLQRMLHTAPGTVLYEAGAPTDFSRFGSFGDEGGGFRARIGTMLAPQGGVLTQFFVQSLPGAPKTMKNKGFDLPKSWFLGTKTKVFDGLGCPR